MSEVHRQRGATETTGTTTRRTIVASLAVLGLASDSVPGKTLATRAATLQGRQSAAQSPTDRPTILSQEQGEGMDLEITHLNPEGMHKNPAFTQAVVVEGSGKTIYIGGQNAVNAEGQVVGAGDVAAQTMQIFANLEMVLAAAGATLHDVIKWTVYVVQGHDFLPGFAVFQQKWGTSARPPVVTAAIVAGLANPEFLVEIEAIAVVRSGAATA